LRKGCGAGTPRKTFRGGAKQKVIERKEAEGKYRLRGRRKVMVRT